jgi:hypothetical protein
LDEFGRTTAEYVYYEKKLDSLNEEGITQTVRIFPCQKWFRAIDNLQKIDIVMYALIIIYNSFSLWVIQLLPKYERYKTKWMKEKD